LWIVSEALRVGSTNREVLQPAVLLHEPLRERHAMTIGERVSGAVTILDVRGRLTIEVLRDMALAERVRRLLQAGHKQILLNLKDVSHLDTTGLCNIVEAYVTASRQNGSVKLLHLTAHVRELLTITRLLTVFEAYESEEDAVASFEHRPPA
jgi:anti-sigma B factor antagonist